MRGIRILSTVLLVCLNPLAMANPDSASSSDEALERARKALANIFEDNARFVKRHNKQCFEPMLKAQHPRVTLVSCSDSRVHTYGLDETPDNDLFVIRNIGNQIANAEGSVEYGVHHLHTPVLLVLGHTGCGAVKAALGNPDELSPAIRKEIIPLKLSHKREKNIGDDLWNASVVENVHSQVGFALKKFAKEIKQGSLVVVGAVYDLHNIFKQEHGKLVVVNVNGVTDPKAITKTSPIEGLDFPLLESDH